MIDIGKMPQALADRFGLKTDVSASRVEMGQQITIRPAGIEHTVSFKIDLILGWRSISAKFCPGPFASSLVNSMGMAGPEQKAAFAVFADALISKGAEIFFRAGNETVDPVTPERWPSHWPSVDISMKKVGIVIEHGNDYNFEEAFPWVTGFLGMVLALLPLQEVTDEDWPGEIEGAHYYSWSKRYERSRINRAACIEVHGAACFVCGFDFGRVYGSLGESFIHVHHITPLSDMEDCYVLNPAEDLIPVCPNCHAMLHRTRPPVDPDALGRLIKKRHERLANY